MLSPNRCNKERIRQALLVCNLDGSASALVLALEWHT